MLSFGRTRPQDYPEKSGFALRRERECGHRRHCAGAPGPAGATPAGTAVAAAPLKGVRQQVNWRYVVGTFAVRIPVTTRRIMLPLEQDTLAIFKWRLAQWPPTDRWYPVLLRYIDYISRRVDGLGGNASTIQPSPWGAHPPGEQREPGPKRHRRRHARTGKIAGLIFDHFGDFKGFELETDHGEHIYLSREKEVERLADRAWRDRLRITVWADDETPHRPHTIVIRTPPAAFG
jgi:hypothetical protein